MNLSHTQRALLTFIPLLPFSILIACSDGGSDAGDSGTGGSSSGSGGSGANASELEERLAECPLLSASSDPTASACLLGTYDGKTLSGQDCSLVLGESGNYDFSSPALDVSHTAPDDTLFVYGHSKFSDTAMLTWKVSDPITLDTWYELSFEARFGAGVPEADSKIQIEVTEHQEDSTTSVVCVVEL